MAEGSIILDKKRGVELIPHIVTDEKKRAFLVVPGGAYRSCDPKEGDPVVKKFNELGYNAFVLRYSVGKNYKWPYPLEDFDSAMRYMKDNADDLHVDTEHIVAAGFSAGGHVVACAASAAKYKPFAAVLCYALISSKTLAFCAPDAPDASSLVNDDTRPCFIATGRNDWIVPVFNTTDLFEKFQEHYIDYEAHIYGFAQHGFSVGESAGAVGREFCPRINDWVDDCMQWLDELESGRYVSIRECAQYNDLYSTVFSTRNSCKAIFENKEASKVLKFKFPVQYGIYLAAKGKVGGFMDTVSLRDLYALIHIDENTVKKIDEELGKVSR